MPDDLKPHHGAVEKIDGGYGAIGDDYAMWVRGVDLEIAISSNRRIGSHTLERYADAKGDAFDRYGLLIFCAAAWDCTANYLNSVTGGPNGPGAVVGGE